MLRNTWYLRHDLIFHISILENIWRLSLLTIHTLYTIIAVSLIKTHIKYMKGNYEKVNKSSHVNSALQEKMNITEVSGNSMFGKDA